MKNIILTITAILISLSGFAQNFAWAEGWGGDSYDYSYSVATDDSGYIYTVGLFQGAVDFDPGPKTFTLTSQSVDGFVMKTAPNGNLLWAQKIGGSGNNDVALAVAVGNNNDIYISGSFSGTVDFDNGPGTSTLTSPGMGYLLRLTNTGSFVSVKQMGAPGKYVEIDNNNNIYTTGTFRGITDFDPSASTYILDGSPSAIFICKLNASGNFEWAKYFTVLNDSMTITSQSLAVDGNGDVYSTGNFESTVDFDPGVGTVLLTAQNYDGYFLKLDINGDFVWVKHLVQNDNLIPYGDGFTIGNSIALDGNNNIHLTGVFSGIIDFNPDAGVDTLNSGAWDPALHYYYANMFLAKYDVDGNYIWAKQIASNYDVTGADIALNSDGDIYTTGYFSGTVDFDPSIDTFIVHNYNGTNIGHDIFVAKYDLNGDFVWAKNMGGSQHDRGYSIALDANNNTYVTGIFENVVDFDPGPTTWNLTTNFIDSEKHNGFLLKLTECIPPRDTVAITTCESEYLWNTNQFTYQQTGLYTYITTSTDGCDSLVTLDLNLPIFANQVTYTNNTLLANPNQPAQTYQWYQCNTPEIISGATQSSYLPLDNGSYALIISNQGCVDTSSCFNVLNMGINEYYNETVSFYPNPIQDHLNISITSNAVISIDVMDVNGKLIRQISNIGNGSVISTDEWKSGVYIIKAISENSNKFHRIIKL